MKQWIILVISILIIILSGCYEIKYLKDTSMYLLSDVYYAKQLNSSKNIDFSKDNYIALNETWKNLKGAWSIYVDHDEIGIMDEKLTEYKANLDNLDFDSAYVALCQIEMQIKHIVEKQEVLIGNIF